MTTRLILAVLLAPAVWTADTTLAQQLTVVAPPEEIHDAAGTSRHAEQEIISAPGSSDILALNPFAFEPFDPTARGALLAIGVARYCHIPGSDCFLHAPVELLSGSTITRLELDAVDSGAGAVRAWFYRCPAGTADCFAVESAFTIDTPGRTRVGTDFSIPEVIDNNAFYYGVVVGLYGGTVESRLEGVRLHFGPHNQSHPSQVLALNQFAFEPRDGTARDTLTGQPRYCPGEDECYFRASIELPSGSLLRRLELDAYDVASDPTGNVYVWLWRCTSVPWSCTPLTIFQTQGAPGMHRVTDYLDPPETIDNATYTYLVTAAATSGTSDTRFAGLRLIFDPPASRQNPEWLTINAYGFEVYSRDEEEAISDFGLRRYCYDSDCELVAPVELPSGSRVTTLMMDVGDSGSGTVETWFHRCPSGQGGCIPLAYQDTVGVPGDTQMFVNLPVPEIIDNDANSYVVAAHLTGGTYDPILGAVRLLYAPPGIFADGFESGDATSWSTSVP